MSELPNNPEDHLSDYEVSSIETNLKDKIPLSHCLNDIFEIVSPENDLTIEDMMNDIEEEVTSIKDILDEVIERSSNDYVTDNDQFYRDCLVEVDNARKSGDRSRILKASEQLEIALLRSVSEDLVNVGMEERKNEN